MMEPFQPILSNGNKADIQLTRLFLARTPSMATVGNIKMTCTLPESLDVVENG